MTEESPTGQSTPPSASSDSLARQRRFSTILLVIGVLAWVPYFYLLARGESPSILPFLVLHLAGVLPGAWLRSRASSTEPTRDALGRGRSRAARALVILGVLVWVPYFYLTRVAGTDQEIGPFLAAHLTGVLGGGALRLSVELERFLKRGDE